MNVVFHRYGNICELDVIESLKKLGLNIIEDDLEITNKNIEGSKRIDIISRLILENQPLFVFSINFFPYISEVCNRVKVLYICWTVDSPILELYSPSIRNEYNRIFAFDYSQYESIRELNPQRIFYLPLATNTVRWDLIIDSLEENSFEYDVSFVGSLYSEKSVYNHLDLPLSVKTTVDNILNKEGMSISLTKLEEDFDTEISNVLYNALLSYDPSIEQRYRFEGDQAILERFLVFGRLLGMEISASERANILKKISEDYRLDVFTDSNIDLYNRIRFHGPISTHRDMPVVFYRSKINLNITMKGIETGIPQRIWDVLGCRGFLMTDYQEEVPEYFEQGVDLVCFENIDECKELIGYYLKHDDQRQTIAENGYKKISEKHTYDLRVAQMIKMAIS